MKTAKCPSCNQLISNVHYEAISPSGLEGGSVSYVATIYPCGHAIGAVPATWEAMIQQIQQENKQLRSSINQLESTVDQIRRAINAMIR